MWGTTTQLQKLDPPPRAVQGLSLSLSHETEYCNYRSHLHKVLPYPKYFPIFSTDWFSQFFCYTLFFNQHNFFIFHMCTLGLKSGQWNVCFYEINKRIHWELDSILRSKWINGIGIVTDTRGHNDYKSSSSIYTFILYWSWFFREIEPIGETNIEVLCIYMQIL